MRSLLTGMLGLMLGIGIVQLASAADARADDAQIEAKFKSLDKNGDSKLSMEEFVAGRGSEQTEEQAKAAFEKADINQDGFLSLVEYKTTVAKKPERDPE